MASYRAVARDRYLKENIRLNKVGRRVTAYNLCGREFMRKLMEVCVRVCVSVCLCKIVRQALLARASRLARPVFAR
jgi:hypothetical protein